MKARSENRVLRHRPICYTGRLGSFLCVRHYVKITVGGQRRTYLLEPSGFIHSYFHSFIHSLIHSVVSYDMSITSSEASSPQSAI